MATRALASAALLVAASPWLAAQQPPPEQPPTYRTGTELVTVDVNVLDRQGQPIRGLATPDFTVTVAGQPRRVVSAEYVDATAPLPVYSPETGISPISTNEGGGTGRLFVFVVDQGSLETGVARNAAQAAARFVDRLTFADRSALVMLPVGSNIDLTWNHQRVRDGLQRVVGLAHVNSEWQYGSLSEARDIANRNTMALRTLQERECRTSSLASAGVGGGGFGAGSASSGGSPAGGGGGSGGGTEGATGGGGSGGGGGESGGSEGGSGSGSGGSGGTNRGSTSRSSSLGGFGMDGCARDLQMQADMTWREAQMTSFASLTALRQALATLAHVRGDKVLVLLSGGMPLDEREQNAMLTSVADEAATARATIYSVFSPGLANSATRRTISTTPTTDRFMYSWSLDTLAGMTGGSSYFADVGSAGVFDRLSRELGGYYRLGVEKILTDADGKARRMKVQVTRGGTTVRSRSLFDIRTYEDRDWTARLSDALVGAVPATGLGIRVTSYVAPSSEDANRLKLVLTGEATRLRPGKATFQVLARSLDGKHEIASTEEPLGETTGDELPFSTNLTVPQGDYIVRVAVMDSSGRAGSVDHRVGVRRTQLGGLDASGPLLVRVPNRREMQPRLALDGVRQDERLALQLDLEGEPDRLAAASVVFEIAATPDGPALVTAAAAPPPARSSTDRYLAAQAVADVRVLPAGTYVARARIRAGDASIGELRRAFTVSEAPRLLTETDTAFSTRGVRPASAMLTTRAANSIPKFAVAQVMAPTVVGGFLDRMATRPDATSPGVRDALERARRTSVSDLDVSEGLLAEAPVIASFLQGLSLLARGKVEPAASAFRTAMRASSDFYPAMIYLGACYAARGQDKEAAGAWRTALIKEGDTAEVYMLLTDALLRTGRGDLAFETVERGRQRWPNDESLRRRYALAAVVAGRYSDGLNVVDDLVAQQADDEPVLALALLVLYEASRSGKPIEDGERDRARMLRLAEAYRTRGGPALALVEKWVASAQR